jgi:ABC-type glycerol-3-phosphate transport system permease component
MPKSRKKMTLEELSHEMRKRADSLDHLTAKAEMSRRQLISSIEATEAQRAAAFAATNNAQYMLWSVIVAAIAAVASAISAVATAYSVWPKN